MSNKDITIKQLESEKKEIKEKLEHYGSKINIKELEEQLFEVNDTIKKLNV